MVSDLRLYESERKEEILKIIEENGFPLRWEDGVDGGIVRPYFDFSKLDEKVLALDPEPEPHILVVTPVTTEEAPVGNISYDPAVREHMKTFTVFSNGEHDE